MESRESMSRRLEWWKRYCKELYKTNDTLNETNKKFNEMYDDLVDDNERLSKDNERLIKQLIKQKLEIDELTYQRSNQ